MAKSKLIISNHKLRKIISFVLAFLLSLSLLGVTALGCVKNGLFSTKTILKLMDEEYCSAVRKETEDALSDYTIPTGIDTWVVEGVVTVSDVTTDVKGYIYAAFAGNEYKPNTTLMDERIKENVVKFFDENFTELDDETDDIIDAFIAELDAVYTASIELRIINAVVKANEIFTKFYMPSLIALLILSLILGILCVRIHHYAHRGMRYVAYAVGGTALIILSSMFRVYTASSSSINVSIISSVSSSSSAEFSSKNLTTFAFMRSSISVVFGVYSFPAKAA